MDVVFGTHRGVAVGVAIQAEAGWCLDISGASTANGAQAQSWDCHGGINQRFTYTSGKQLQVYGNKCLAASNVGTGNGTAVVTWDCNSQTSQQWNVNANGTITGVQSGLCLDANGAGTANGTRIILWTCNGAGNQQWTCAPEPLEGRCAAGLPAAQRPLSRITHHPLWTFRLGEFRATFTW